MRRALGATGGWCVNETSQGVWAMRGDAGARSSASTPSTSRVHSPHVGGGFGSKGTMRPHTVVAALAARAARAARSSWSPPAARCSRSRATGRRRSSASASAPTRDGRITAICARGVQPDLAGQGVHRADRHRRAGDVRAASTAAPRTASPRLDVPTPSWFRAPGETPGHVRAGVGHGRAGERARDGPDRAAHPQRPAGAPGERQAVELARPRRLPARGRRALRLGRARRPARGHAATASPPSMYPTYRAPALGARQARVRRLGHRAHRRRRHRHRCAHRAHPDRRRRLRAAVRAGARRARQLRLPARGRRRRLDGHVVVGLGRARRLPPAGRRGRRRGLLRHARRPQGARRLRPPRLRRPVRRRARRPRHRRGDGGPAPGCVRRRTHHQPAHRPQRSSSAA